MSHPHLEARKALYYTLSSRLAQVDKSQLASLLSDMGPVRGWGGTQTIRIGSSQVFVKRIPVTTLEYENLFSTENLYALPTFYNYGVGSAGFGAFREIVAHIKTTNWVLDGSRANFPLMYHYRIVPFAGTRPEMNEEWHKGYVTYWNGDANIDRYLRDRASAPYEALLFLEHFPDVLHQWLAKNLDKTGTIVQEMLGTLAFLRSQGIIHFDAHFGNILVNKGIPYLTDFGLVLDKSYSLTSAEQAFFRRHIDYDAAEFLGCVGAYLYQLYQIQSPSARTRIERRYGINEKTSYPESIALLVRNIEQIHANRLMKLPDAYVAEVVRHRGIILWLNEFYNALRQNHKKDTPYPPRKVRRLLLEAA